jgi:hypothetical protein
MQGSQMEVEDNLVDDDDVEEFHYEMDVDEPRYSGFILDVRI